MAQRPVSHLPGHALVQPVVSISINDSCDPASAGVAGCRSLATPRARPALRTCRCARPVNKRRVRAAVRTVEAAEPSGSRRRAA